MDVCVWHPFLSLPVQLWLVCTARMLACYPCRVTVRPLLVLMPPETGPQAVRRLSNVHLNIRVVFELWIDEAGDDGDWWATLPRLTSSGNEFFFLLSIHFLLPTWFVAWYISCSGFCIRVCLWLRLYQNTQKEKYLIVRESRSLVTVQ